MDFTSAMTIDEVIFALEFAKENGAVTGDSRVELANGINGVTKLDIQYSFGKREAYVVIG